MNTENNTIIPILHNIDANTQALLDAFSVGVTGHFAKAIIHSQKKTEKIIVSKLPAAIVAVEKKLSDIRQPGEKKQVIKSIPAAITAAEIAPVSKNKRFESADAAPVSITEKTTAASKRQTPPPLPFKKSVPSAGMQQSKSSQAVVEKRHAEILEQAFDKQESRWAKLAKPVIGLAKTGYAIGKDQVSKNKSEIKDAVGIGVGGPFYAATQELSGIGGELKDIYQKVRGKTESGDKKKPKDGRDEFGRYVQQTSDVMVESRDKTIGATQQVKNAVEKSEKEEKKRHRQLIQALLSDAGNDGGKGPLSDVDIDLPGKKKKKGLKTKPASVKSGLLKYGISAVDDIPGAVAKGVTPKTVATVSPTAVSTKTGGAVAKGAGKLVSVGGKAMRGFGAVLGKVAGPVAVLATAVEAIQGFNDTEGIKNTFGADTDPTTGQRVASAVANIVDMGGLTSAVAEGIGLGFEKSEVTRALYASGGFLQGLLNSLYKRLDDALPKDEHGNSPNPADTMADGGHPSDSDMPSVFQTKTWKDVKDFFMGDPDVNIPSSLESLIGKEEAAKLLQPKEPDFIPSHPQGTKKPTSKNNYVQPKRKTDDNQAAFAKSHSTLGSISEKYESGGRGAGTVSTGKGDIGGVSYGTYQMASKGGQKSTAGKFVSQSKWADQFQGMEAGTKNFSDKWKSIAASDPEFAKSQRNYIKQTYYDPMVQNLAKSGIDLSDRPKAVQDMLWSRSVHHGSGGGASMIKKALAGADMKNLSDEDLISKVYAESGKTNAQGELAYFRNNSSAVQANVKKRLTIDEPKEALAALRQEKESAKEIRTASIDKPKMERTSGGRKNTDGDLLEGELYEFDQTQKPAPISASLAPKQVESAKEIQPPKQAANQGASYDHAMAANKSGDGSSSSNGRSIPPSQAQPQGYNIPMEFDDSLLTLMIYDRI